MARRFLGAYEGGSPSGPLTVDMPAAQEILTVAKGQPCHEFHKHGFGKRADMRVRWTLTSGGEPVFAADRIG